jgi:uncharacterized protein (DUF58 family)
MWFKKSSKTIKQHHVTDLLASIKSNGIELSIDELLQYQQKSSLIDLKANRSLHGQLSGNYLARTKGRGMEFDEVRHYQTGDDIRAIDWRVTARTGKTHTKLFREEIERPVLIATDLTASMQFGSQLLFKAVQAAHIAALMAWHAKNRGDRIGGIVFNQYQHQELKPRSRKAGVLHYLHTLIELQQQALQQSLQQSSATENMVGDQQANGSNTLFADNCARLRQLARPGSLVYLLTDGHQLDQEAIRHLSQISRHCELVIVQINDPLELNLPELGNKVNVVITNGKQRQQLTLGDKKTALNYQQNALLLAKQQQQLFTKAGARVLKLSASNTIEQQLKQGADTWIR